MTPADSVAIASNIVIGVATAVLAAFGGLQLHRDARARAIRELAAAARISATGYLLRQRLLSWVNRKPGSVMDLHEWIGWRRAEQNLEYELGAATASANEMASLIGDAGPTLAISVRRLFVAVVETTQRIRAIEARQRKSAAEILYGTDNVFGPALASIDVCLGVLEADIIEPALLEEERRLSAPASHPQLESPRPKEDDG